MAIFQQRKKDKRVSEQENRLKQRKKQAKEKMKILQ